MGKNYLKTILSLAVIVLLFSGCQKVVNNTVVQPPVVGNGNGNGNGNGDQVASSSGENQISSTTTMNNYEITNLNNDWITFKSNVCDFEISFPKEFKWSKHCEKLNNTKVDFYSLIYLYNVKEDSYPSFDGHLNLLIVRNIKSDKDSNINNQNNIKEQENVNNKLGDTVITHSKIEVLGSMREVEDIKYFKPIEGPPGIFRNINFDLNGYEYSIHAQIPYNNKDVNNIFKEIMMSININKI